MSNDPIIWANLTANQRDAIVAEHVFRRTIIAWRKGRDLLMEREGKPGLTEAIPAYTESMDAAWPLFKVLTTHPHPSGKFVVGLEHDIEQWYKTQTAQETATKLCLAALALEGVEIDMITEKTVEEVYETPVKHDLS